MRGFAFYSRVFSLFKKEKNVTVKTPIVRSNPITMSEFGYDV
jgi:hypothetical protein